MTQRLTEARHAGDKDIMMPPGMRRLVCLFILTACDASSNEIGATASGPSSTSGDSVGQTASRAAEASTNGGTGQTGDSGESGDTEGVDAALEALARARSTLVYSEECGTSRKVAWTDNSSPPNVMFLIQTVPDNGGVPGETTKRTYVLPGPDAPFINAVVGDFLPEDVVCEDAPPDGELFIGRSGEVTVELLSEDKGCAFSCDRLYVEMTDMVFTRFPDEAVVELDALYIPTWIDPEPPE